MVSDEKGKQKFSKLVLNLSKAQEVGRNMVSNPNRRSCNGQSGEDTHKNLKSNKKLVVDFEQRMDFMEEIRCFLQKGARNGLKNVD